MNDIYLGENKKNGLALVQFDLSSIYNSSKFTDCNNLIAVLPAMIVVTFSTNVAGTGVAPVAGNVYLLSLKNISSI